MGVREALGMRPSGKGSTLGPPTVRTQPEVTDNIPELWGDTLLSYEPPHLQYFCYVSLSGLR